MIGAALALLAAAPAQGCADHWAVELDRPSFADNGAGRAFTSAQLTAFRAKLQTGLRAAANHACRSRKLAPVRAAAVRRVRVLSASGATEPHVYPGGRGRLNLEYVFAEERLAVPPRTSLVSALTCWANPSEAACAEEGD